MVVGLGLLAWDQLAGADFHRLHPDLYVGAATDVDTRVRIEALSTWSRDSGVVGGPLAALAYGADCPWTDAEIVLTGHRRLTTPGVTIRREQLPAGEIAWRFGCRITTPVRTAFDLARRSPLCEAVAAVDAVAHAARFTAAPVAALVEGHPGVRGLVQVRKVLDLMDPRAESLPETRLRVGLLARGVPAGVPQYPLTLLTGERIRLDLGWPRHRFGLEFNGPDHRSIAGQNRDAFRTGRITDIGWETLPVTSAMVLDPAAFDELALRVLRRLARGSP